jgi:hypothetical protein
MAELNLLLQCCSDLPYFTAETTRRRPAASSIKRRLWLTAAIKAGAKRDDFLVDKSVGKPAKKVRKKRRAKKE